MSISGLRFPPVAEEYKTIESLTLERIRGVILSGELKPGDRIRQHWLADQLGVSRMPVRVALRRLSAEGLVDVQRGVAIVSRLSVDEAEEIYAMRLGLESLAARVGAERVTPEALGMMRSLLPVLQEAADARDVAGFLRHDRSFHLAHYEAAGRPSLVKRILDLWQRGERYMRMSTTLEGLLDTAMIMHRRLLEACERRDGRMAQQLTRDHLDYSQQVVIASLREKGIDGEHERSSAQGDGLP